MSDVRFDARFVRACSRPEDLPPPTLMEVAVAGRSNCGKSSLVNALAGTRRLARTGSTPGRTRQLVFFQLRGPKGEFFLVDLPGYGYARASKTEQEAWARLVNNYIDRRGPLTALLLLTDIRRRAQQEEQDLLDWAAARDLRVVVVLTKADKLNRSRRFAAARQIQEDLALGSAPIVFSVQDLQAVAALRRVLVELTGSQRGSAP